MASRGSTAVPSPASRGLSLRRNGASKPRQAKMTQMSGLVRLGRREVSRSHSPTFTDEEELRSDTPPPPAPHPSLYTHMQTPAQTAAVAMPTAMPIRMRVRVQEDVFLIPVPQRFVSY
ncbi:hypothetical protein CRUP_027377 [Coryphaenoides rupestris]|nr:hypothetical protein CRUP_027377 [Coryphaenoides rupestris]